MKKSRSIVSIHIILGALCSLPILVTVITGLFLILRSHLTWMQPTPSKEVPVNVHELVSPETALNISQIPVNSVNTIIYKPHKGIIQIRTDDRYEYHLSAKTGAIINDGAKRTSLFIRLHEGSFFGTSVRDFIFLPAAILLLISLLTGIYLSYFWFKRELKHSLIKRKKRAKQIPNGGIPNQGTFH